MMIFTCHELVFTSLKEFSLLYSTFFVVKSNFILSLSKGHGVLIANWSWVMIEEITLHNKKGFKQAAQPKTRL